MTSCTESKYAQIEKEALAVTWACERSSNCIVGKSITIETDHKPLVPLLMKHTLDKLPPRVQRYKMRLMRDDPKLSEISKAQDKDKACRQVKKYCLERWPDKDHLDHDLKPYY